MFAHLFVGFPLLLGGSCLANVKKAAHPVAAKKEEFLFTVKIFPNTEEDARDKQLE